MSYYKTDILGDIHQMAIDLYQIGLIDSDKMDEFDVLCMTYPIKGANRMRGQLVVREEPDEE